MSYALLEIPAARWLFAAATIVSIAVVFFIPILQRQIALWRLPLVGKEKWDSKTRLVKYLTSCEQVYDEGYRQFQAGIFRVTSNMELPTVFVGPKYLKELSKMPESSFSSLSAFQELMMVKYTKVEATAPVIAHTVKTRLTPSLAKLSGYLDDEVRSALTDELPDCDDWTNVQFSEKLIRVVSRVSGRAFVGANLCRSEEYIDHTINYTRDVMLGVHAVGQVKKWLRSLLASSLPEIQQLNRRRKLAADFFMPVVLERIEKAKQDKPEDLLQWLIDMQAAKYGDISASELARKQLDISFAAIHTTNAVALNTIYTLAAMPKVQSEIREEVRTVLSENKGESEYSAVQKMKKLDSFIRESVRCYPIGAVAFRNKTLKPIGLSDGIVLPEGIIVETSVSAIGKDPALFDDPETFDHLRFYSSPEKIGDTTVDSVAKKSMVTVGLDNLIFGYGKHACPGRFFAVHEIKAIIAEMVMRFEFSNTGDYPGRYPNLKHGAFFEPDRSRHLLLKKIDLQV
ncbi:cytochrome P450 [Fusarium redolens]|uniref:Cytochrome P450 n=1 Tax=Fusarium redolens TaxID=48865 RepID=A0A9P9GTP2_FUSRE|nr:cytochrome P450 [Fusarium redolens]KAH7244505.1 cytochrome P450 [Fusarium redolens]